MPPSRRADSSFGAVSAFLVSGGRQREIPNTICHRSAAAFAASAALAATFQIGGGPAAFASLPCVGAVGIDAGQAGAGGAGRDRDSTGTTSQDEVAAAAAWEEEKSKSDATKKAPSATAVRVPMLPRAHIPTTPTSPAHFYVMEDDVILFPMSFSIPKQRVLSRIPEKTAFALNDSARSFQIKRYQFGPLQEEEYHQNIQRHRFGDTRRKGGHDCLRHYEILANGCVPIFHDLEHLPPSILTTLPKHLLMDAKRLFTSPWEGIADGPGVLPRAASPSAYEALVSELLNYTAKHLTTEVAARKILETTGVGAGDRGGPKPKVLFLPCVAIDNFPSFLAASVFHGLLSLLGDNVVDVPEYEYAYAWEEWELRHDPDLEYRIRQDLWGQGFTVGFKHKRRPYLDRSNIPARIKDKEFDLIVFARMSPYEPCNFWYDYKGHPATVPQYFENVHRHYPPERVALLYGDDSGLDDAVVRTNVRRMGSLQRALGIPFMRELLPFVADGPMHQVLRPVDSRTLQVGCFYEEWLDFFGRWQLDLPGGGREPGGLRACVAQQPDCDAAEVEAFLGSYRFQLQQPSHDQPILLHFCRSGYALRTALLIARLGGPTACAADASCRWGCDFCIKMYARGFTEIAPEVFHAEFGVTAAEVVFLLNVGCGNSALALQPAVAQARRVVAIVARAALPTLAAAEARQGAHVSSGVFASERGPYASVFQILYLLRQGFQVLLVGGVVSSDIDSLLYPFVEQGRLRLSALQPERCSWMVGVGETPAPEYLEQRVLAQTLHHVHFESSQGDPAVAAHECFATLPQDSLPPFVSLQLRHSAEADEIRGAVTRLSVVGYRRFKASALVATAIGAPFGELAPDAAVGTGWRSAADVLTGRMALTPGGQLHAAL